MNRIAERLRSLDWRQDRLIADGTVFRLEHARDDSWELGDRCFTLYKTRPLVDQYAAFFAARPDFHPRRMLELGMWDWGSGAFWLHCLEPAKYVGVDWFSKDRTEYLEEFLRRRNLTNRFRAFWQTDQSDAAALQRIVEDEFAGELDLIIDDASHMHALTRRSLEILLPYLRPGGYYIIEDWAWSHWPTFNPPPNPWLTPSGLTPLITEVVEMIGTSALIFSSADINSGFAAFERARDGARPGPGEFALDHWISRRTVGPEAGRATAATPTEAGAPSAPGTAAGPPSPVDRLVPLLRPLARRLPESFFTLIDRLR